MSVRSSCTVVTLSTTSVNFNTPPRTVTATLMQDPSAKRGSTNKLTFLRFVRMTFVHRPKFHTQKRRLCQLRFVQSKSVEATNCFRERTQPYPEIVRIHQIRHRAVVSSSRLRKSATSQCSLGYSLRIACFSSSLSLQGPFIVKSAQLFDCSNGFSQLVHPSGCSKYSYDNCLFCTSFVGSF